MTRHLGRTMLEMKMLFMIGIFAVGTPGTANAGKFSSLVANPFVFCSAPKPCKQCHPWRYIYEEICSNKVNPKDTTDKYEMSTVTETIEVVDPRTMNGRAIRAVSGIAPRGMSLNEEGTVEGLGLISRRSGERPVEGLEVITGPLREAQ